MILASEDGGRQVGPARLVVDVEDTDGSIPLTHTTLRPSYK